MDLCKHDEFCGGCIFQGTDYENQLSQKNSEVLELLEKNEVVTGKIEYIEGCPNQYRYRNKMEYTFGDLVKDGPLTLGMHKKGQFMSIVTVDECQLVTEDFNKILNFTVEFCVEKGYAKYHKRQHTGLLRNLIIRKGFRTGELLVNIVTSSDGTFADDEYVKGLLELGLEDHIVGILHTYNDNLADAVIPERVETLYGHDYYMEEILGLKFKVSAFSFFQTNIEAVERLYKEAIDLIPELEGKDVFDLYCGAGTISQIMALKAKHVLGVEIVEEAVESAKENAKLNGLDNCEFIAGDVFEVLENVEKKPEVIVVDPPRVGIQPKALDKILSYGVENIVYVSCNPKTLAPNLAYMENCGYKVEYLKPFDNFPFTKHVECVVLMSKKK